MPAVPSYKPIPRTSAGLRDVLFDEIDLLRRGEGDPARALAISKIGAQIIAAAKLEHEVAKFSGGENYTMKPLELGTPDETASPLANGKMHSV